MKLVACFIFPRQRLGDIKHTTRLINTVWNEKFISDPIYAWQKSWSLSFTPQQLTGWSFWVTCLDNSVNMGEQNIQMIPNTFIWGHENLTLTHKSVDVGGLAVVIPHGSHDKLINESVAESLRLQDASDGFLHVRYEYRVHGRHEINNRSVGKAGILYVIDSTIEVLGCLSKMLHHKVLTFIQYPDHYVKVLKWYESQWPFTWKINYNINLK